MGDATDIGASVIARLKNKAKKERLQLQLLAKQIVFTICSRQTGVLMSEANLLQCLEGYMGTDLLIINAM